MSVGMEMVGLLLTFKLHVVRRDMNCLSSVVEHSQKVGRECLNASVIALSVSVKINAEF